MSLPGVRGVGATRKDGRKAVAVYYGSETELERHISALPEESLRESQLDAALPGEAEVKIY